MTEPLIDLKPDIDEPGIAEPAIVGLFERVIVNTVSYFFQPRFRPCVEAHIPTRTQDHVKPMRMIRHPLRNLFFPYHVSG
jgi:hypothetical protein